MLLPLELSHRTAGITSVFDFVPFRLIWALFLTSLRSVLPVSIIMLSISANNYSCLICLISAGSASLRFSVWHPKQYLTVSEPWHKWKPWPSSCSYSFSHLDWKKKKQPQVRMKDLFSFFLPKYHSHSHKIKISGEFPCSQMEWQFIFYGAWSAGLQSATDCRKPLVIRLLGKETWKWYTCSGHLPDMFCSHMLHGSCCSNS